MSEIKYHHMSMTDPSVSSAQRSIPKTIFTQQILTEFYEHLLREEKSTATAAKYLRVACTFFDYVKTDGIAADSSDTDAEECILYVDAEKTKAEIPITCQTFISYKNMLTERCAPATVNAMIAALNCLLRFLHITEFRLKSLRTQRQTYRSESKELTNTEYNRLLKVAQENAAREGNSTTPGMLALLLQTFGTTGIRVSELRHFTVESVKTGKITIQCKGKIREILLTPRLQKELLRYSERMKITSGAIFLGKNGKPLHRGCIWAQIKRLCHKAGVEESKVYPHNLRKLFARNFYEIEKDISALADILGHSNIETTRIYIMTTGREHCEKLQAVERTLMIDWNGGWRTAYGIPAKFGKMQGAKRGHPGKRKRHRRC